MDLEEILKERASIFDRALTGNLKPREPEIFYDALRWIPLSGGKRLRPILAMLACEVVGGVPESTIPFGIALEYMHNSTLVHDDIIDKDKWRRGLQTTHEKFGVPFAILAGDALIGETYRMLSYMAPPELNSVTYKELIRSIADAAKDFYEGEALDIEFAGRLDVTIPQYMRMIEKKTGQLYYLAGKGGALIGKGNNKQVENMALYGTLFGLMFQIKDDLLNILTEQIILGKQMIGSDILNGKRTLMFVHALTELSEKDKKKMMKTAGNENASQQDILEVIDLFRASGSIAFAENKLAEYRDTSKKCLDIMDSSESKDLLIALADYSVTRLY
ncbi:MAG TPA: polyprenyl synthetase family protein [Thermoplasmata archaeon]|jgi:geranylgeranyl diphosphate synthase type I|nr:polyprenyl synthetase family protein [Thermoplasmata archaeon]